MTMKLVGIANGTYTSKKDGQRKEGYRFYFVGQQDNVVGQFCEPVWVRKSVGDDFLSNFPGTDAAIGQECRVSYDRFRYVQDVIPVVSKK